MCQYTAVAAPLPANTATGRADQSLNLDTTSEPGGRSHLRNTQPGLGRERRTDQTCDAPARRAGCLSLSLAQLLIVTVHYP